MNTNFKFFMMGGFLLALNAGFINAISVLSLLHQAVSHVTGTVTRLGIALAAQNQSELFVSALIVTFFFLGNLISGFVIGDGQLKLGRRYGAILMIQAAVIVLAIYFLHQGFRRAEYLLALACGLQNGMATSYSHAVVRSTHMSGIVSDLGIMLGQLLRQHQIDTTKGKLLLTLLTGFTLGGSLATVLYQWLGFGALWIPAISSGGVGLGYYVYRQWLINRGMIQQATLR